MKAFSKSVFVGLITVCCFVSAKGYGQTAIQPVIDTANSNSVVMAWLQDLYEPGVLVKGDSSITVNKETQRLIDDKEYRALMYPETYTWQAAVNFIKRQELKQAFWYFINLYMMNDQNKELVIKSIVAYDKIFKMDKALESTFYTYGLTDPTIGSIENGHSEITAPHILDKKLMALKSMLFYLQKNRPADKKETTKGR